MKKLLVVLLMLCLCAPALGETTFSFPSNPTTGYEWSAEVSTEGVLAVAGEYVPSKLSSLVMGAGGRMVWTLTAIAPGEVTVTFRCARSWETEQASARTLEYTFRVDEEMNITLLSCDGTVSRVALDENATTTYRWTCVSSDPEIAQALTGDFIAPEGDLDGAPGKRVFYIHSGLRGEAEITFNLVNTLDPSEIAETLTLKVLVTGAEEAPAIVISEFAL